MLAWLKSNPNLIRTQPQQDKNPKYSIDRRWGANREQTTPLLSCLINEKPTCYRSDLETLGSRPPMMSQNLPGRHWNKTNSEEQRGVFYYPCHLSMIGTIYACMAVCYKEYTNPSPLPYLSASSIVVSFCFHCWLTCKGPPAPANGFWCIRIGRRT